MRLPILAALLSTCLALPLAAAEPAALGTADGPAGPLTAAQRALGTVFPANVYSKAGYGSGAVGLRNRLVGGIEVSAVVGPVKAAFLYWAVITSGAAPAPARRTATATGTARWRARCRSCGTRPTTTSGSPSRPGPRRSTCRSSATTA